MNKITLLFILIPFLGLSQVQIGQDIIGAEDSDQFGISLDCNSDGNIIVVGASNNSENGNYSGQVQIFENISGVWTQIGSDIVGEDAFNYMGRNVAINDDGNIVAISEYIDTGEFYYSGRVRVFIFEGGDWIQYGSDINESGSDGDNFGASLALNSNGNIIAIGATHYDSHIENSGHVQIFENISGEWTQIGSDIEGLITNDRFGWSTSLSNSGDIVAISAKFNDENGVDSGKVQIFENVSGIWTQIGSDIYGQSETDQSGHSIDLNGNGNIIAIGSPSNDNYGNNRGYIRVFENISGEWIQIGSDIVGEENNDNFGLSVSLNNDGNILAGGGPSNGGGGIFSGHVRVYRNESNSWVQIGVDINGENTTDRLGTTTALNNEGNILVVGAPNHSFIKVFDLNAVLSTKEQAISNFEIYPNPTKNHFKIELDNTLILEKVSIYNTLGQVILMSEESNVNTSNLASGSYIVEVTTNQGQSSKKLIIE